MARTKLKEIEGDFNSFPLFNMGKSTNYLFGANNAWVSDIWAFWNFILLSHKTKLKGAEKKYAFLQSLLEQSKYFFQAAENAPIKSQPLLYYYSFMNLAKIVINISVNDEDAVWWNKKYKHGLSELAGSNKSLNDSKVICREEDNKANIAPLFLSFLGDVVVDGQDINVKELLSSCLGIHRAYTQTYNAKEVFYRLDNCHITVEGKDMHFEASVHDCNDKDMSTLNESYHNISKINRNDDKGNTWIEYVWKESFSREKTGICTKKDLYDLATVIRHKRVWGITNGEDVSLYISNTSVKLSTEGIIYVLMFFFGSITRYNPFLFDELLSDENKWLMCEFLKTQPKQFIYLVTNRVLGRNIRQSWMTKL